MAQIKGLTGIDVTISAAILQNARVAGHLAKALEWQAVGMDNPKQADKARVAMMRELNEAAKDLQGVGGFIIAAEMSADGLTK